MSKSISYITINPVDQPLTGHGPEYHNCFRKAVGQERHLFALPKTERVFLKRFREYSLLFRQKSPQKRIFFLEDHAAKDFLYIGLAAFWYLKPKDRLWLVFRDALHHSPIHRKFYKFFWKLLQWKLKDRVVGLGESDLLTSTFGKNLTLLPIPHTRFSPPRIDLAKPILCWWPGEPRETKGLAEIQKLAASIEPHAKNFSLILAENTPIEEGENLSLYRLPIPLDRDHYHETMEQATCLFLPYDAKTYRTRTSGIFVEGIVAGKVPLVKKGTWLAHQLKKYDLEELIVDWDRANFFSQVEHVLHSQQMWNKLHKMQKAFASFHSLETYSIILNHHLSVC